MFGTPYTVVLTNGSVCTDERGRDAILHTLRIKESVASITVVDTLSGETKAASINLLELITILKHDSGANPAVLKTTRRQRR